MNPCLMSENEENIGQLGKEDPLLTSRTTILRQWTTRDQHGWSHRRNQCK